MRNSTPDSPNVGSYQWDDEEFYHFMVGVYTLTMLTTPDYGLFTDDQLYKMAQQTARTYIRTRGNVTMADVAMDGEVFERIIGGMV